MQKAVLWFIEGVSKCQEASVSCMSPTRKAKILLVGVWLWRD